MKEESREPVAVDLEAMRALERMRTAIRQEYGDGHEGSFAASCRDDYETVRAALAAPRGPQTTDDVRVALGVAAKWFREYEAIHKNKPDEEFTRKAERNRERAEFCEAALAPRGVTAEPLALRWLWSALSGLVSGRGDARVWVPGEYIAELARYADDRWNRAASSGPVAAPACRANP